MMLQKRGISYSSSKGKKVMDYTIPACQIEDQPPKPVAIKKPKLDKTNSAADESTGDLKDVSSKASDTSGSIPGSHRQFRSEFDSKSCLPNETKSTSVEIFTCTFL